MVVFVNSEMDIFVPSLLGRAFVINTCEEEEAELGKERRYDHKWDSALHLQSFEGLHLNAEFSWIWNEGARPLYSPLSQYWIQAVPRMDRDLGKADLFVGSHVGSQPTELLVSGQNHP